MLLYEIYNYVITSNLERKKIRNAPYYQSICAIAHYIKKRIRIFINFNTLESNEFKIYTIKNLHHSVQSFDRFFFFFKRVHDSHLTVFWP